MKWFDYETTETGYKPFYVSKDTVKSNKGKRIVYVRRSDVDSNRGYCFPQYGILDSMRYSELIFDDENTVDSRDIIECGIMI